MSRKPNFSHVCTAAALALSSGTVFAQSSLTLYGTLDASLTRTSTQKGNTKTSTSGVASGVLTDSYIGFKGVESLGNGIEVSFMLESYIDPDTGATSSNTVNNSPLSNPASATLTTYNIRDQGGFWARSAYIGIKTDFGLIRLGQMDSLGYMSAQRFSPFGTSKIAPSRIFYNTDYYTQGWSNALAYFGKVGDVAGGLMYGFKESSAASAGNPNPQQGNKWSATLGYFTDTLSASIGYEDNRSSVGSFPAQNQSWFLNSFYDFGVAKIYAQYGFGELDRVSAALPDVKSKGYQLGATMPVAANAKMMVSYSNGVQELSASGQEVRDATSFAIGASYDFSKRTDVYALFSEEKNDYTFASPFVVDDKIRTLAVGVRHRF